MGISQNASGATTYQQSKTDHQKKEKKKSSLQKEIPIVEERPTKLNEYQPYDSKDECDYSLPMGADRTTKIIDTSQRVREDIEGYNQISRGTPPKKVEAPLSNQSRHSSAKSEKSLKSGKSSRSSKGSASKRRSSRVSPQVGSYFLSSQYAKDQAQDNLKHQPLPDTISDQIFRAMQMKQEKHPGITMENLPKAAAVGHKKFVSPGPTQCSKLKIFRPKTAENSKLPFPEKMNRPKTCNIKNIGEIDLAICWDLVPEDPHIEPKRPVHIDGSNGSVAPSVFTIVKPKEESPPPTGSKSPLIGLKEEEPKTRMAWESEQPRKIKDKPVNPSAVMDIINNNLDIVKTEIKENEEFRKSISSGGKGSDKNGNQGNPKKKNDYRNSLGFLKGSEENQNPNIPSNRKDSGCNHSHESIKNYENGCKKCSHNTTLESFDSEKLAKQKHYRSSPNLSNIGVENSKSKQKMLFSRPCMACEIKPPAEMPPLCRPKSEYKMAFKAGVPNGNGSNRTNSSGSSRPLTAKHLMIPKPKTPFAKRSYSINTLAPPFSLWPGTTGMDYPEHWRLASVYQHSFKPIEQRKKPLLQRVFH